MAGAKPTSTDKLLDMIRVKGGKTPAAPAEPNAAADPSQSPVAKTPPSSPAGGFAAAKSKLESLFPGKGAGLGKAISFGVGAPAVGGKVVVGGDLGPDSLRMSKTSGSATKRKLLAYQRVPYDPSIPPTAPEFAGFLRSRLKEFATGGKVEIWSLISSAKAELWHITIPKVPRRQITEAVYWSVKKEKQFDETEFILDFDVLGEVTEKGVPKFAVTVYLAPRKQVEDLTNLFSKAGFKLTGVSIAPIAIQTLFRTKWVQTSAHTYANLYVGRNWSRIDIFQKGNLVLSRGIKAGTNSMVEALVDSYNQLANKKPQVSTGMETIVQDAPVISMELGEDEPSVTIGGMPLGGTAPVAGIDFEQAKKTLASKLLSGGTFSGPGSELDESDVVEMILPAAERLVRQIERTFEYHSTTMGNEPVEQIYFSGSICTNKLILQYMYGQLGIESLLLDPLHQDNPALSKLPTPESVVERMEYNLVIALSLSDNEHTPNLLYTYKSKEKDRQTQRVEKIMYLVSVAVLLGLLGVWSWQRGTIGSAKKQLAQVQADVAKCCTPRATPEMVKTLADAIAKKNRELKRASQRYETVAALSEINQLSPSYISALTIKMDLGHYVELQMSDAKKDPKDAKPAPAKVKQPPKNLIFDGFIEGKPTVEECKTAFSSFLIRLENSILFEKPTILKEEFEEYGNKGKVYRFNIQIPLS